MTGVAIGQKPGTAVMLRIVAATLGLLILPVPCWGLKLEAPESAYQGDLILGRTAPGAMLFLNGEPHPVSRSGHFAAGIARDRKTDVSLKAWEDSRERSRTVRILAFPWTIQRIDGLPERYVAPPPLALKQIQEDNRRVASIRKTGGVSEPLFLKEGFILPVSGPVTGPFGTLRILNGRPRSPHSGVDFGAAEGSTVVSPASGVVRLVATGMYLMGNVLIIDHGLGVQSIFIHLQDILVGEGDRVDQGQPVALVGKTGRATGPHLHWGISVGTTVIDPARLLERTYR